MNAGRMIFVFEIPARFEQDLVTGRKVSLQLNVDATAMAPAGNGAIYIQTIIMQEITNFLEGLQVPLPSRANIVIRSKFNPELYSAWFSSIMQVIASITMLAVILTGAALIRERESGTVEHLLVMPVVPPQIMWSKIIANTLVILIAAELSLLIVVQWFLAVPIAGSIPPLFLRSHGLRRRSCDTWHPDGYDDEHHGAVRGSRGAHPPHRPASIGWRHANGKRACLASASDANDQPDAPFRGLLQGRPLSRRRFSIVWPKLAAMAAIGSVYFAFSLKRFRSVIFGD